MDLEFNSTGIAVQTKVLSPVVRFLALLLLLAAASGRASLLDIGDQGLGGFILAGTMVGTLRRDKGRVALQSRNPDALTTFPIWMPLLEDLKRALAVRDRAAANAAVAQLLDRRAQLGAQWRAISELMRVSGELTLAHRAMDAFVAAAGHSPQALYSKAVLFTQSGRMREAHDCIARLPPDVPDRAGHAYVLGNMR